jgi:hypothetical protein
MEQLGSHWTEFHEICKENQNTQFTFINFFQPRKSCRFLNYVEKYCGAREATQRTRIALWLNKATVAHSKWVTVLAFPRQQGCTNALQCYVICTLPVLLFSSLERSWHDSVSLYHGSEQLNLPRKTTALFPLLLLVIMCKYMHYGSEK